MLTLAIVAGLLVLLVLAGGVVNVVREATREREEAIRGRTLAETERRAADTLRRAAERNEARLRRALAAFLDAEIALGVSHDLSERRYLIRLEVADTLVRRAGAADAADPNATLETLGKWLAGRFAAEVGGHHRAREEAFGTLRPPSDDLRIERLIVHGPDYVSLAERAERHLG